MPTNLPTGATVRPVARPEFNPGRLVQLAMEVLGERYGVPTVVDSVTVGPAVTAAADLLRALGVTPSTAPEIDRD